jgi:hypothetical protein
VEPTHVTDDEPDRSLSSHSSCDTAFNLGDFGGVPLRRRCMCGRHHRDWSNVGGNRVKPLSTLRPSPTTRVFGVVSVVPSRSTMSVSVSVSVRTNSDRTRVHSSVWERDYERFNGINALAFIATVALTTVVMKVRSVARGERRRLAQPEHRVAEEADDSLRNRGLQTFDEHLHSIVDEHNLLRRED